MNVLSVRSNVPFLRCPLSSSALRTAFYTLPLTSFSCVVCAKDTFADASGTTPRQLVESAQAQCKAIGYEVTGVDLSALDGAGDDKNNINSGEGSGSNDANDDDDAAASEAITDTPTFASSAASTAPAIQKSASSTPAQSSSPAKTAAPTGAGVALKAQHVLASLVAAGLGAAYFL